MKRVQKEVDKWVGQYKVGYFKPHEILASMIEEVGEVAREVNHRFGSKKKKDTGTKQDLGDELADIIFTIVCLANSQKIDLDKSFHRIMKKYNKRDDKRWERKNVAKGRKVSSKR